MKTRLGLGGLVLASILLAGCSTLPLRTAPAPAQACMDALATGALVASNQSGLALKAADGTVMEVLWPFGYSARREPLGVALLDERGHVLAREGDVVQMGGGLGGNDVWHACVGSISVIAGPS